jgi:hypothetical protein
VLGGVSLQETPGFEHETCGEKCDRLSFDLSVWKWIGTEAKASFKQPSTAILSHDENIVREQLVLWAYGLVYATGRLSITGDGFQSGYKWLSVRLNGP